MGKQKRTQEVMEAKPAKKECPLDAMTLLGKYRRPGRTLDNFLREKQRELDVEEQRDHERHKSQD